ncbi:MAG: rod-binding protein [Fimbriimonas ginsengisoli]|uniref:Rod-binding protein n=1 Tax=Fimbriimonas ginsengisoli TaxID=1005039 RepID=A0A931PV06_FIMGI|nr:rod-binding protein [Fimbriimonas ginsengisoli]
MAVQAAQRATPKLQKLREAAKGIEAIFVKELVSQMRKSVHHVAIGQSMGAKMYDEMFDQALAESAARKSNFGIAEVLTKQFSKEVLSQEITRLEREARTARIDIKG